MAVIVLPAVPDLEPNPSSSMNHVESSAVNTSVTPLVDTSASFLPTSQPVSLIPPIPFEFYDQLILSSQIARDCSPAPHPLGFIIKKPCPNSAGLDFSAAR